MADIFERTYTKTDVYYQSRIIVGGGSPVSTTTYHSPLWHHTPFQCVFSVTSRVKWQCWNCYCLFQWVGWVGRPNPCRRSKRWRPLRSPTCFDTLGVALGRRATVAVKTAASSPAQTDSLLEVNHLTVVKTKRTNKSTGISIVISVMAPCSLVGGYRRFRGTKCHRHRAPPTLKMETVGSSETLILTRINRVIIQKPTINIFTCTGWF